MELVPTDEEKIQQRIKEHSVSCNSFRLPNIEPNYTAKCVTHILGVLVSGLGTEVRVLCDVGFFSPCLQILELLA
jgi:hypothetical protein